MKKRVLVGLLISSILPLAAQEKTLFSGGIEHGGFGGPVIKLAHMGGHYGIFFGGHGGWVLQHKLWIGGGGYGLINRLLVEQPSPVSKDSIFIEMAYGGGEIGLIFGSSEIIHFEMHTLFGAGAVSERRGNEWCCKSWEDVKGYQSKSKTFFIVEPQANLELNVTRHFRVGAGAAYRLVFGLDGLRLRNGDLEGSSASLSLHFGSF